MVRLTSMAGASPAYDISLGVEFCEPTRETGQIVQRNLAGGVRTYQMGNPKRRFRCRAFVTPAQFTTLQAMEVSGQHFAFTHDTATGADSLPEAKLVLGSASPVKLAGFELQFEVWEV